MKPPSGSQINLPLARVAADNTEGSERKEKAADLLSLSPVSSAPSGPGAGDSCSFGGNANERGLF